MSADKRGGSTIVLGAGVIGVATAYYLNRAGHRVMVIERQSAAGLETSLNNGCIIHASEVDPWSQPGMPRNILRWLGQEDAPLLLRYSAIPRMWRWGLRFAMNCTKTKFRQHGEANLALALHSLRSLQEIRDEIDIGYDLATNGVMRIYRTQESLERAEGWLQFLETKGLIFQRVTPTQAVELEPALAAVREELTGGFYFPHDEVGDYHKFTQGLAAECAKRGVEFRYQTAIRAIETERGRVTGAVTDKGRVSGARIVAALGSFTPTILKAVRVDTPIYPIKGVSITFPRAAWNKAPRMPIIDDRLLFGLLPLGDRVRLAGSAEITGYDAKPAVARCDAIVANASKTFPSLKAAFRKDQATYWAGLRPVTPAGTPLIGRTRIDGLWVNSGHGHLGWTMACGSGRVLTDLVEGRDPGIPLPDAQGCVVR
jgi:D-amino-acid dehydrogenase